MVGPHRLLNCSDRGAIEGIGFGLAADYFGRTKALMAPL
ncbi:MAG: hypothetical protein LZF60_230070 [Nitrospira sp.]|nr:MAG: hypothetical protein LZF60_230070 [Nitrospira sp.]